MQQQFSITYADKDKERIQTPAATPKEIQLPSWKKHRIKLLTALSYHYTPGSVINISSADATYEGTDIKKQHWYTLMEDIVLEESSTIKLSKQLTKLQFQETIDKLLPVNLCPLYKKLNWKTFR
ncbi:hypothetical protein G9A89_007288 [Geosiphon pyriformis]|nr:hypothetical protein G9A89_007288 [Geosiphon pyriformis]